MVNRTNSESVSIRPGVSILSVLKHLEYETWYALAEFVDNAIASYLRHRKELKTTEGKDFRLEVDIDILDSEGIIRIRDNAAGIHQIDYARAFRAAEIPPDNTGLSEFGMGMKSAACWFSDKWSVSTSALGEPIERKVRFDLRKIFDDKLEELDVKTKSSKPSTHYTVLELTGVTKIPRIRGLGKVREHLAGIYRQFIRDRVVELRINGEPLGYKEPRILVAPRWDDPTGEPLEWKKEIDIEIDSKHSVKGFAALRERASTSEAGFALFRRGRVIEGSFDKTFRPEEIFGSPNSYRYQRVFGELHLKGFAVSFTKRGIQWDSNLENLLSSLKKELSKDSLPLLQQAENYRVRATDSDYKKKAKKALASAVADLEKHAGPAIKDILDAPPEDAPEQFDLTPTAKALYRDFDVVISGVQWEISVELSYDPALSELIEVGNHLIRNVGKAADRRRVGIRLSIVHPFMVTFVGTDEAKIEIVLRLAAALGISEVIAKQSGVKTQGEIRRNFNELITTLSEAI